jgi:hypothetical protein
MNKSGCLQRNGEQKDGSGECGEEALEYEWGRTNADEERFKAQ